MPLLKLFASICVGVCLANAAVAQPIDNLSEAKAAYARSDYAAMRLGLEKDASNGSVRAATLLGLIYGGGLGVKPDVRASLKWYRIGAEGGNREAQYNLAILLAEEPSLDRDDDEALRCV